MTPITIGDVRRACYRAAAEECASLARTHHGIGFPGRAKGAEDCVKRLLRLGRVQGKGAADGPDRE